ncbi:MAG: acyl-CoA synthetase FdrA [Candidatus Hadarchaeota archaeon]
MAVKSIVRRGDYRDSVVLMRVSQQLEQLDGVSKASAMMATDNNKELLKDAELLTDEIRGAGANDLVIVVDATNIELAEKAAGKAAEFLSAAPHEARGEVVYKTAGAAFDANPDSNLAIISTPGDFAAREAMKALNAGKHVMIFSSDVPIDEELKMKKIAAEKGLLVMGPDCGTAILGGIGLGFSNVVRRGPVGIVGAAGTGIQEVSSILDEVGVSHAIGTGSHDLSDTVGGITMLAGLEALEADEQTKVIVLISKPPSPKVSEKILEKIKNLKKPAVVDFIGGDPKLVEKFGGVPAITLEDAALKAMSLLRGKKPWELKFTIAEEMVKTIVDGESKKFSPTQKYIRGLFSGGTLCAESLLILRDPIGDVYSNVALKPEMKLTEIHKSKSHTCVDMGTEDFVRGVPHPMIDFRFRRERILRESKNPEVAVILLDVVLGIGANSDPAGELAGAVREAKEIAAKGGRYLSFVASVCGTNGDPQGYSAQKRKLEDAGVVVMPSNAQAVRMAALIATRGKVWGMLK